MKVNTVETIIENFRDGQEIFRKPSAELLIREIARLTQRVRELEDANRWVRVDNTMIVTKDGNRWCAVLPNFIDLQNSESYWFDPVMGSYLEKTYHKLLPPLPDVPVEQPQEGE